jgi:hypothetical protein
LTSALRQVKAKQTAIDTAIGSKITEAQANLQKLKDVRAH